MSNRIGRLEFLSWFVAPLLGRDDCKTILRRQTLLLPAPQHQVLLNDLASEPLPLLSHRFRE